MLLSMLISFLLARRFRGITYVLLTTVALLSISLLSFGFPPMVYSRSPRTGIPGFHSFPLSFPLYSFDNTYPCGMLLSPYVPPFPESYELHLLNFKISETISHYPILSHISYLDLLLRFLPFFLIINIVGVILGYEFSKLTFTHSYLWIGTFVLVIGTILVGYVYINLLDIAPNVEAEQAWDLAIMLQPIGLGILVLGVTMIVYVTFTKK